MSKYKGLTDKDIEIGLENGRFEKGGRVIRDSKTKEIVKHINDDSSSNLIIPTQIFQCNQNITHNTTVIYQINIEPILNKLIEMKNIELFDELSEKYETIIKNLEHYKSYNDKDDLKILNKSAREALSKFEQTISKLINELKKDDFNHQDVTINILYAYINILFLYLISSFKLYQKKILNDTIIKKQIFWLKEEAQNLYKQLLVKSNEDSEGRNIISNIENSLYGYLFLEKRNKDDLGIYKIKKYLKYDRKFKSIIDFIEFFIINKVKVENIYKDKYINGSWYYDVITSKNYYIQSSAFDIKDMDKKINFVDKLFNILEEIKNLQNIYKEIIDVANIEPNRIESYFSDKSFELLAI